MNCSCEADVLAIAVDARVTSERDGSLAVTWNEPSQWGAVAGASGITVLPLVLNREETPTLTLVAERSGDGRSFTAIDAVAARCVWGPTADPQPVSIQLTREEATPTVRFGLQVAGSGSQAAVRLTLFVVIHRSTQLASNASTSMGALSGTGTPIEDATTGTSSFADATFCSSVVARIDATGITGSLDVELQTSDDGSTWVAVPGASATIVAAGNFITAAVTDGVLRYVRLATTATNAGSASTVSASVWVRA